MYTSHYLTLHVQEPPRLAMMNNQNKLKIIEEFKKIKGHQYVRETNNT